MNDPKQLPPAVSFVLANSAHGALIVSRFDRIDTPDGGAYGVGAQILHCGAYEAEEVATINQLLDLRRKHFGDGVVMIDCGANIGVMTIECAEYMRGWGTVTAYEPQERLFYALAGNIALHNCFNARAVLAAVGNYDGEILVPTVDYCRPGSFGSLELIGDNRDLGQVVSDGRLVPLVTIDGLLLPRVDLLKIDVEGMEIDVLRGAAATILRCKPIIVMERVKSDERAMVNQLDKVGYRSVPMRRMNVLAVPRDAQYVKFRSDAVIDQAVVLGEAGEAEQAMALIDDVLKAEPNNHLARINRAALLMQVQRHEEAIAEYGIVLSANSAPPTIIEAARFGTGFANLVLGNLREGFAGFEHRKKVPLPAAITDKPELTMIGDGERVPSGQTVLLVGEMGFGDNIMFLRYAPMLAAKGASVIVSVPPSIAPLARCLPSIQVHGEHSPPFDCWARMMSLARVFGTDIDSVPTPAAFELPATAVARWRAAMTMADGGSRLRVGLCWSGNRESQYDRHRNVPFAALAPLFDAFPEAAFYSLQLDVRDGDRAAFDKSTIYDVGHKLKSFLDTACVVANLDLVITVDTSVAHLAGTVGVPTWVILTSFRTYWLWIRGRNDSPWYPSARCFRQTIDGEWGGVVAQIAGELAEFAASRVTERTKRWPANSPSVAMASLSPTRP